MRRDEVQALINEVEQVDGARRYLFGQPAEQLFVGLGASPVTPSGDYQLVVLLNSWTAETAEATEQLRERAEGQVRVQVTGPFELDVAGQAEPEEPGMAGEPGVLSFGDSVGPLGRNIAGTLGFFAELSTGGIALVSNSHVLAPDHDGNIGGEITSPSQSDGDPNVVASVAVGWPMPNHGVLVDASAAILVDGVTFSAHVNGSPLSSEPLNVSGDMVRNPESGLVHKRGRTTGTTAGIIDAVDTRLYGVDYGGTAVTLTGMITVASASRSPFSDAGDSGSLVYSPTTNQAVGLHVGSTRIGQVRVSACHPITAVLAALDARIATDASSDH